MYSLNDIKLSTIRSITNLPALYNFSFLSNIIWYILLLFGSNQIYLDSKLISKLLTKLHKKTISKEKIGINNEEKGKISIINNFENGDNVKYNLMMFDNYEFYISIDNCLGKVKILKGDDASETETNASSCRPR